MFDIFLKKSKVVLDCFTYDATVHKFTPIQRAANFIPEWWKSIPKDLTYNNEHVKDIPQNTMRGCPGFLDTYAHGFVIPMWSDLIVSLSDGHLSYQFAGNFSADSHNPVQYNYNFNDYVNFKLMCPWIFKTKENINFYFSSPLWNFLNEDLSNNFHILPGMLNFYVSTSHVNVNLMFYKKPSQSFFKFNSPIYYFVPLSEKKIIIKNHIVTQAELNKLCTHAPSTFKNSQLCKRSLIK